MKLLAHIAAAWLGVNLGILAAAVHDYRAKRNDQREVDELCALIDATRETGIPEDAWDESYRGAEVARMERTPIHDAAWLAAIDRACRIEVACEEFAEEVAALADSELRELIERGEK